MKRTETFQNLILLMLSDGKVSPEEKKFIDDISYQLGITDEEYEYCFKNIRNSYHIPNNKEDAFQELYKMILLTLSDGEIEDEEEQELYIFAQSCGFTEEEYQKILSYVFDQYTHKQTEVIEENKKNYDNALLILRQTNISDKNIVKAIRQIIQNRDLNYVFSEEQTQNHAFYALLWLIYCRYVKINSGGLVLIVMILDLIEAGEYVLEDLFIDLKLSEEMAQDGQVLHLFSVSTNTLKEELKSVFPFKL